MRLLEAGFGLSGLKSLLNNREWVYKKYKKYFNGAATSGCCSMCGGQEVIIQSLALDNPFMRLQDLIRK